MVLHNNKDQDGNFAAVDQLPLVCTLRQRVLETEYLLHARSSRRPKSAPQPAEAFAHAGIAGQRGFRAGLPVTANPRIYELPLQVLWPKAPRLHDPCSR